MASDQETHAGAAGATNFDERALAGLEPAEREAILGSDGYGPGELEALRAVAGQPAAAASVASHFEGAGAELTPLYTATLPQDYNDQVTQLKTDSGALVEKFKNGEIDVEAYQAEADRLADRREQLGQLKLKADLAEEMNAQNAARAWQGTVDAFFARAAGEGVDYMKDAARRADLDSLVRVLATREDTETWPMSRFLEEAHKRVMVLHGQVASAPAPAPAPASLTPSRPASPKDDAARRELADLMPAPQANASGQFDTIDSLDGDDFVDAIARMPAWQRERFARGG